MVMHLPSVVLVPDISSINWHLQTGVTRAHKDVTPVALSYTITKGWRDSPDALSLAEH